MAYFRVTQKQSGGGGGGATITVTYDSSFYNKTITCSDGTTTYTSTTTSSGSTTFNVSTGGTWTISCNGFNTTVSVVLSYSASLIGAVTKTITVYSAANDTLSFSDNSGSKTVTTDSSGSGSVSITYSPGVPITFTSSVAKDPSNLSNYYSKAVTLQSADTEVYVMPDNVLYWYGYGLNVYSEITESNNGWTMNSNPDQFITVATNSVDPSFGSGARIGGLCSKNTINATKLHAITACQNSSFVVTKDGTKTYKPDTIDYYDSADTTNTLQYFYETVTVSGKYAGVGKPTARDTVGSWYAVWYE